MDCKKNLIQAMASYFFYFISFSFFGYGYFGYAKTICEPVLTEV